MPAEQPFRPAAPDSILVVLRSLARDHVLSEQHAKRLAAEWPTLDAQAWHQPWYRDIREHTRAYLDELRGEF